MSLTNLLSTIKWLYNISFRLGVAMSDITGIVIFYIAGILVIALNKPIGEYFAEYNKNFHKWLAGSTSIKVQRVTAVLSGVFCIVLATYVLFKKVL